MREKKRVQKEYGKILPKFQTKGDSNTHIGRAARATTKVQSKCKCGRKNLRSRRGRGKARSTTHYED